MPPTEFKYHAFISYSSKDRPWAKQLADDLAARKFNVFLDVDSLRTGENWKEQLTEGLDDCKHLIVLWSHNADDSEYVKFERYMFYSRTRPSPGQPNPSERREILIMLEEPGPNILGDLQTIRDLLDTNAYGEGFEKRDVNVWSKVVSQIERTIRRNSDGLPILVAVLATTRDFLEKLDFDEPIRYMGALTLNNVITQMGISSKDELLKYYGATRDEWCPFGDNANIGTVLDSLKLLVAEATDHELEIAWQPIGANLWSDSNIKVAKSEAYRLCKGLSLVIIDPISLFDDSVKNVLEMIEGCFSNTKSVIMVLTPYKMPANISLRNIIESRAISFLNQFYLPPVPPVSPFANFGANIGDEIDMNRLVLMTLGQYVGEQKTKNNFTNP